jgi:2-polyprenyl-6-methoxyphenol hydroxylase-like FAD-dependent oxidoreductase
MAEKDWRNKPMEVRFLGCSAELPSDVAVRLRQLDSLFFQGHHSNGSFLFFGIQQTPAIHERGNYRCQINVSWQYQRGFLGRENPTEVPDSPEARLSLIQEIANHWEPPFRDAVRAIPTHTPLQEIKLEDWVPSDDGAWNNMNGRATLVGDAAHAMTMYRGEAVNHGITDVYELMERYLGRLRGPDGMVDCGEACDAFEKGMIGRTKSPTIASRRACWDAHHSPEILPTSPLVSKRAIVV